MQKLHTGKFAVKKPGGTILCPICKRGYPSQGNVKSGVFTCPNGCGHTVVRKSARGGKH